jgi:hypothetical protein
MVTHEVAKRMNSQKQIFEGFSLRSLLAKGRALIVSSKEKENTKRAKDTKRQLMNMACLGLFGPEKRRKRCERSV